VPEAVTDIAPMELSPLGIQGWADSIPVVVKLVPVTSTLVLVPTLPATRMLSPMARSPVRLATMVAVPDVSVAELMMKALRDWMLPYKVDLDPKLRMVPELRIKEADQIWLDPVAVSMELLASVIVLPPAFSLELTNAVPLRTALALKVRFEA